MPTAPSRQDEWVAVEKAIRQHTPLVIGLAGPTKSGKTYSAHRLAQGLLRAALARGGDRKRRVWMLNAEGPRGHQYADRFDYSHVDIRAPYSPERFDSALKFIIQRDPAVIIIDSASHMHDGPGGMLEQHDEIQRRMAGDGADRGRLEAMAMPAWVKPKADENQFVYTLTNALKCPVVLCFRAKEKIKMEKVRQSNGSFKTEVRELGWQPIAGERVAFETLFTLMLPPHCKGVPDLAISDLRDPFDALIPKTVAVNEDLGAMLAEWAAGKAADEEARDKAALLEAVKDELKRRKLDGQTADDKKRRGEALEASFNTRAWPQVEALTSDLIRAGLERLRGLEAAPAATTSTPAVDAHPQASSTPATGGGDLFGQGGQGGQAGGPETTSAALWQAIQAEVILWDVEVGGQQLHTMVAQLASANPEAFDPLKVDVAMLADILATFRGFTAKDPSAVRTVNALLAEQKPA